MKDITTVKATRKAIRECSEVLVRPQFGTSERWVKIRKSDAMDMMSGLADDETPESSEMYSGVFASLDENGTLYLG